MQDVSYESGLLTAARALFPRLASERDRIEATRRVPHELARELAAAGFFRAFLPETYGGLDLTPMQGLAVFEALAQVDASVAWCIWNGNTHWVAAQLDPDVARTIHADQAVITANSTRASGHAHIVPGGYRVRGRWSLVSGCELAAWLVLLCVVHADGKARVNDAGTQELRFALLPREACEIIDTWTVGGLRGTGSHDVAVQDAFVPAAYSAAFTDAYTSTDPRYRMPPFCRVIPGLGAMALGIARTAIDCFAEIAGAKTPERTRQMLRDNHGAQTRISQAESLVRSARLYLFDSVDRLWRGVLTTGEADMQARANARMAASHAVASSVQAVDLLYVGAGANSMYTSCLLERAFRDVHAITLHIGVHPRVLESTGRVLLGLQPDTPLL